jgi:hypothetical protein
MSKTSQGGEVVTVTENAKRVLKEILMARRAGPDEGLRLLPAPTGNFLIIFGTELSGDLVIEYEGYKVLLIGIEYLRILDGKTVDCRATEDGAVLFVR